MENSTTLDNHTHLDRAFLDAVDGEIQRALRRVDELEADLDQLESGSESWRRAFDSISLQLTGWETRLSGLTRQTHAVEAELQQQESALRDWFLALGATNARLESMSRYSAAAQG